MAFDHGRLEAGGRAAAVSEIELEVREGSTEALYDLALG